MAKGKFAHPDGTMEAFETGFNQGDQVEYQGKSATVKQIVILGENDVQLLIDVDGVEQRVPASAVTK